MTTQQIMVFLTNIHRIGHHDKCLHTLFYLKIRFIKLVLLVAVFRDDETDI